MRSALANAMTLETWLAFLAAAILISVSPGAGAVSCMAAGMRYGYRLGVWNIFGMQVGIALQHAIVGAGLRSSRPPRSPSPS